MHLTSASPRRARRAVGSAKRNSLQNVASIVVSPAEQVSESDCEEDELTETSPKLDFIPSPEFEVPDAENVIMADMNDSGRSVRRVRPPVGLPAYMAALYEVPLLTAAQEQHLFRQFNYLKWKAHQLKTGLNPRRPSRTKLAEIERLLEQSVRVRESLARANLRLVVANARHFADVDHSFDELVSDGNLSLLQAIEKFDYTRGFRFSTYATHAIRRTYYRRISRKQREKTRVSLTSPELLCEVAQPEGAESVEPGDALLYRRLLMRMSECLNERELQILKARFSIETSLEAPTLQVLARTMGICKERVRQLQNRAIEKLRELAEEIRSEFDPDLVRMDDAVLLGA